MIASRRLNRINMLTGVNFFNNNPIFFNNFQKNTRSPAKSFSLCTLMDSNTLSKVSRACRVDAQNALFDYLHSTRSFNYTDAEHVSRNSPAFLQTLISKIEGDDDVSRSVTRFLRYHPINEFEPFFESLGLKPAELRPLLPRNLMFLCDDDVLLANYHVICNYGVPRSKIGRMYMEAREIFEYGEGALILKFQAYERLGLSRPTIIKLVTCCPDLLIGDVNADFMKVLVKLKDLGVELDWIRASLSDKSTYNWNRIHDMLHLLDGLGCDKKSLARFIKEHPKFVFDQSGKKIYLLVAILLKLGLKREGILNFFENYPRILTGSFVKNLWSSVQFLSEIGMEAKDIIGIVSTHAEVLGSGSCMLPTSVLEKSNISSTQELCKIIKKDPRKFSDLATRKKLSSIRLPKVEGTFLQEKTTFLLKIGFVENSEEMAKALSKYRGRGDQLQERFDCLVNAGLDCHAVAGMVRSCPTLLNQSTETIQMKLDYLLNDLGYQVDSLVAFPSFLNYNLEKIKLRLSMYKWLREKGIVIQAKNRKMLTSAISLSTLLAVSEARFVKYVVNLHPEGPLVWERLKSSSSSS